MKKILLFALLSLMAFSAQAQDYLLGDVNRDSKVTVADAMMVVNIIMKGYTPFSVSPTKVTIPVGGTAMVEISGGYNQYEVTSANTSMVRASLSGHTITLTAVASGETKVSVKDILTMRYVEISVSVSYASLQLSESELSLTVGDEGAVGITSGSGSYTIRSSDTGVATASLKNGKVNVTAVAAGTATITVTDTRSGQTATIEVTVNYQPLALSATSVSMFIGDERTVDIASGSGSYSIQSSDANVASADIDGNTVSIIAYGSGTATVTVSDTKSGETKTITVTVDYLPLTLSASTLELNVGEENTITITSGHGSCTVTSSDENVATVTIEDNSVIITAIASGTATIIVTDTQSRETSTIEVTASSLCPDDNHPHMIDLGLPSGTKWACCNEGASKPEEYGGYYGFRHVSTAPSMSKIEELVNNCSYRWTTLNGVKGGKFTSKKNGCVIFLPAAGGICDGELSYVGKRGDYWSSTTRSDDTDWGLTFDSGNAGRSIYHSDYYYGDFSVRSAR